MKYVHNLNIIHRNLNPMSIFIIEDNEENDDINIKIGEFGISELFSLQEQLTLSTRGILGNIKFIAPELTNDNDNNYDKKVDVFSFGVLIIFIINEGILPKIGNKFIIPSNFNHFTSDLIKKCIKTEPKNRPSFKMISDELEKNYNEIIEMTKAEDEKIKAFIDNYKDKKCTV